MSKRNFHAPFQQGFLKGASHTQVTMSVLLLIMTTKREIEMDEGWFNWSDLFAHEKFNEQIL